MHVCSPIPAIVSYTDRGLAHFLPELGEAGGLQRMPGIQDESSPRRLVDGRTPRGFPFRPNVLGFGNAAREERSENENHPPHRKASLRAAVARHAFCTFGIDEVGKPETRGGLTYNEVYGAPRD